MSLRNRHTLETCKRFGRVWRSWRAQLGGVALGCGQLPARMKGLELWARNGTGGLPLDDTFLKAEVLSSAFIAALSVTLLGTEGVLVHFQLWVQSSNLSWGPRKVELFVLPRLGPLKK